MRFSKSTILILFLSFSVLGLAAAIYRQLSAEDRADAIGAVDRLNVTEKVIYTDLDDGSFQAKTMPSPSDWLAQHQEPGQTFTQYLKSRPNLPNARKQVIYILPLGKFPEEDAPSLKVLLEYAKAYYHPMKVVMKESVSSNQVQATKRMHHGEKQWMAGDVLKWMYEERLPGDAYAMIAVTMTDLYPKPEWNYVFGLAALKSRVGVFSFARYTSEDASLMLERAAKVLSHETGHMFGIRHCIFYQCNMNGANHLGEMDDTPMHLCPVCLRKIQHAVKFDPIERYQLLHDFYVKYGLADEATWTGKRLKMIKTGVGGE